MKVSVWDTYVRREDGRKMHFDILVPSDLKEEHTVFGFGGDYLKTKSIENHSLTTNECRFCHIEHATEEMQEEIKKKGYTIIEMENCD
jgi:hypothetical protein